MANLLRSAKSANDWESMMLLAYHITIELTPPTKFYGPFGTTPSLDSLDPAILRYFKDDPTISDIAIRYLRYLNLATGATQKSFIDNFARETLSLLGFEDRNSALFTCYTIPFTICGETIMTETDVVTVLLHLPTGMILLVVVQERTLLGADGHIIAEAIAAYQSNNFKRETRGLQPLERMTVPCISMSGTHPTFYLVPVTEALSHAVVTGQYPQDDETKVLKCVTVSKGRNHRGGMETLEYRQLALQYFLAFKDLARSHWVMILDGL